jgi:hypothetical protein
MSQFFGLLIGATGLTLFFGTFPLWILAVLWVMFFIALIGKAVGGSEDS